MNTTYFQGKDGFVWWNGVVEDRKDPLFLGRCRVRILGWHTANKSELPTDMLPWAFPIMPLLLRVRQMQEKHQLAQSKVHG